MQGKQRRHPLAVPGEMFILRLNKASEKDMAEAVLNIKQWGNNLGVRLPAAVARAARLHVNQQVRVTVEKDRVVITSVATKELSLEQMLALYNPARHGGEVMAAPLLGAERL
jgi:antitoxin MazE